MKPWIRFILNSLLFFVIVLVISSILRQKLMLSAAVVTTVLYAGIGGAWKLFSRPRKKQ